MLDIVRNALVIAALMLLSFFFQQHYMGAFNLSDRVSLFYLPAAVITLSSLTCGYQSAIGLFAGGLLINVFFFPTFPAGTNMIVAAILPVESIVTLMLMALFNRNIRELIRPATQYSQIDAFDVLYFCSLHAILNTGLFQLLYVWDPAFGISFDLFAAVGMLVGDITGSFLVFIALNLLFSVFKRVVGNRIASR